MTYRQILLSVGIACLQLLMVVGLVWATQPRTQNSIALSTRAASVSAPVAQPVVVPAPIAAPAPSVAALTPAPAPLAVARSHPFTVVSWGGEYQAIQRDTLFQPFMAETGKALEEINYEAELNAAAVRDNVAKGEPWDVVSLEYADVLSGCQQGLLEPIDWARVGNTADFIPAAVERCGVGSIVWAYVLAYNPNAVTRTPVSWADLWAVDSIPGKRALRKSAKLNLEVALLADGVSTRDIYAVLATPAGIDRAFAKLEQVKSDLLFWEGGQQPFELIAADQVVMTAAYNGRVTAARKGGLPVETVWTNIVYSLDFWVVARGTPNLNAAYDFLSYVSQPQPLARMAERIPYGPANLNAIPLVDATITPELPTAPANLRFALLSSAEFWNRRGPELEARFSQWAQ